MFYQYPKTCIQIQIELVWVAVNSIALEQYQTKCIFLITFSFFFRALIYFNLFIFHTYRNYIIQFKYGERHGMPYKKIIFHWSPLFTHWSYIESHYLAFSGFQRVLVKFVLDVELKWALLGVWRAQWINYTRLIVMADHGAPIRPWVVIAFDDDLLSNYWLVTCEATCVCGLRLDSLAG